MIRIGGKPGIYFIEAQNDMSHFMPSHYVCSEYHYVTDDQYMKFIQFTDPTLENPPKGTFAEIGSLDDPYMSSHAQRVKAVIDMNPGKSLLWQYNGLGPDMKSFYRHVVLFGKRDFQIWSDYDAYIKLPMLRRVCDIMNVINKPRADREQRRWDKFLTTCGRIDGQ